ncbi:DoxX family protein [Pseudohaliea sp.]|uniref:DoxX family protein n=1 Tax=Pseudohaliea sp. TaxID=2740289 RepID=UPI0032EC4E78
MQLTFQSLARGYYRLSEPLVNGAFLAQAAARFYVAWVFFASGLTKLRDWETTLFLFEYEYSVPLLPFDVAAWLATAGEIALPILLLAGFASRFAAAGLFIVNAVAVVSLEELAPAALNLHYIWGILLLQIFIWGGGLLSFDRLTRPARH